MAYAAVAFAETRKNSQKQFTLGPEEIERLILEHRDNGRKLARSFLRKWRARISLEEVDSIVDLTLCEAARRFRPDKGACFMTFVFYHLRGYLVRAVAAAANSNNIFHQYAKASGVDPTAWGKIADDVFPAFIPDCASFGLQEVDCPEGILLRKEKVELCRDACSSLDELEQEVINRSFVDEESLVAIARKLGYSRCHISRVKKRALERLSTTMADFSEEKSLPVRGSKRVLQRRRSRRRSKKATVIQFAALRRAG